MITPSQEQITAYFTTMTSKGFYETAALSRTTFVWISSTMTTLSSTAPPWLSDFLGETLLFFAIGDDFDSYRTVNTAIVLLTAWIYYKAFRMVFLTMRFIFRTILGIYRIVRSVLDKIFGLFYSMARSFSSFISSEEKEKSNSNNCQRLQSGSPNQQQQQQQHEQEPEFVQQHRNSTSVNMTVPTVVGLQRPIPMLPPTFSLHKQQHLPQPERIPSMSPQLQEKQPAWIATPPPGVLRYNHCSPMAPQFVPISYPSVPMASFPTPQQQQQQQQQQIPPTSSYIDPPPLPRAPAFVSIPHTSDNNKSDNSNSEDEDKMLCSENDSEDDPDGDWNEQSCLRVMLSNNDTKNSKHKNASSSTTATTKPTKGKSKMTVPSSIKSTTTEQGNKRKRGATKSERENKAPTQQSKKHRIAEARANAKKWANETFGK